MFNLREFAKTHGILTPGALFGGCEPQSLLHFRGIRGIRHRAPKMIFEQNKSVLARSGDLKRQKNIRFCMFVGRVLYFCNKNRFALPSDAKRQNNTMFFSIFCKNL